MVNPQRIWSSPNLPTLPGVAIQLVELSKNPETEVRQVIEVIRNDPAISARILKASNSSYFGLRSEVTTIDRAVTLLGTTVTSSLALSFSLSDQATQKGPMQEHFRLFWRRCIVQAAAAEVIGSRQDPDLSAEYFLAGLLIDLGQLAILKTAPHDYRKVLEASAAKKTALIATERELLDFDHIEIGTKLMEQWKLPKTFIEATKTHHGNVPSISRAISNAGHPLAAAVAAAAAVGESLCSENKVEAIQRFFDLAQSFLGMDRSAGEQLILQVNQKVQQVAELFNVNLDDMGDPADIMAEANEQLAQLTMREHVNSTQATMRHEVAEQQKRDLEDKNRLLQQQALHDPLTKLYNRNFFDETINREVDRCRRVAAPVGVIFLDVDFFKKLNDTYGHAFGDEVLVRLANLFKETCRTSDVVSRFGGEEFVILVGTPSENGLQRLCERLRTRVEIEPFKFEGQPVKVTVSLGAAITIPSRTDTNTAKVLLELADGCLYQSKHEGRNRVTVKSVIPEPDRHLIGLVSQHRFSRFLVTKNVIDIPNISKILLECPPQQVRVGELAVQLGYLVPEQVTKILAFQEQSGDRFCQSAVRLNMLTGNQVVHLLAIQQEDPRAVAGAIIRSGLIPPQTVATYLDEYQRSHAPTPAAALA